tara:strand:+ start:3276 stop:3497 length:222 start_codon:yes stop_codon:yes gene_type:complete
MTTPFRKYHLIATVEKTFQFEVAGNVKDLHEHADKKARELMEKELVDIQEFNKDVKEFVTNCNVRIEDDYTYE